MDTNEYLRQWRDRVEDRRFEEMNRHIMAFAAKYPAEIEAARERIADQMEWFDYDEAKALIDRIAPPHR